MAPRSPPRPAPAHRVFALAWLMAGAFSHNGVTAVAAYPMALLTVSTYAIRRHLYESHDGHGMVIFGRLSFLADGAATVALMIPALAVYILVLTQLGPLAAGVLLAAALSLVGLGALVLSSGSFGVPVGPETPKGRRFQVAGLAQRPGTRLSALMLALRLRDSLPAGSVLVAAADNDRLLRGYQRLGFIHGRAGRVHWSPGS